MSTLSPQQIIETALAASQSDGCVVVVDAVGEANVRWANSTVTTSGLSSSLSWYVVAIHGQAAGTVEASAVEAENAETVAAVVKAAEAAAKSAAESGPARDAQPLIEGGADDDFADEPATETFDVYATMLPGLAASFEDARAGDRILYGFARHDLRTTYLGTSTGIRKRWVQPTGMLEVNAKSADLTRSAWAGMSTKDFTDLDVAQMSGELATRLGWAERRTDLPPGRYPTVLPPSSVADFLIYQAWMSSARAAHEGRSMLAASEGKTKLGERLTERPLTLYLDPNEPELETSPFVATGSSSDEISVFDNGTATGRQELLTDGVLSGLLHTRASAAEYGEKYVGAADNLILRGGTDGRTVDDIVRDVEDGLLVTSLWYIRAVDPMTLLLTGLTRDGVFRVQNGEVTGAVNNFRFNMSPLDVLRRAADVGETKRCLSREWSDWFTRTAMPPILVDGFNMSSVSQAQ